MLASLILSDEPQVTRERLVGLLWSESTDDLARGSLRHALHEAQSRLRGAKFNHLVADKITIHVERSRLSSDIWDVLSAASAGEVHPLLLERTRLTDHILSELDGIDPAFDAWLRERRQAVHTRLLTALEQLLPGEKSDVSQHLERIAHAILLLEPTHEKSARVIIRARWRAGDVGSALSVYNTLWQTLENEFDVEPSPETQSLVARLRLDQPEAIAPVGPDNAPSVHASENVHTTRPSIAVLPFATAGEQDKSYFGEGIVDDIIQALAGLKELLVIARGSTLKYRGEATDVKTIGRELGVKYVLQGNVRRSQDLLRIHTVLVDAVSGEVLRTSRYDGKLDELFNLQDQIALETTNFIAPFIRERELKRAMRKHPTSITAYDLVLQALGPLHDLDYSTFSRARTLLTKAISLDPEYAPAQSYASYWHCYRIGQEWSTDIAADSLAAESYAARAIDLDHRDSTALAIHAHVQSFMKRDYARALAGFERALAASPNSAFAWTFSAATHSFVGDGATAVAHARTGIRLSPYDSMSYFSYSILSQAHFVSGDFEEAVRCGKIAFERNPRLTSNLRTLAASLVEVGKLDEARRVAETHFRIVPGFQIVNWLGRTPLNKAAREQIARNLSKVGVRD